MKQARNPEYRKELIIYIIVTVVIGAALLFVDYRCTIAVCVIGAALTVLHYIFARKRYKKIAELSARLMAFVPSEVELEGAAAGAALTSAGANASANEHAVRRSR